VTASAIRDFEVVARIGDDLRAAGFDSDGVLTALGPSAHRAMARGEFVPALRATRDDTPLATAIRLFLLGRTVSQKSAAALLPGATVDLAVASGALERDGDDCRAAVDIRPHADDDNEYLVVADLDSDVRPGPLRPDHVLGIGSASLTLARATIRERVGSVLDVGIGCGIQSLHAGTHADTVTGTDVNPRALALAAATARINGLHWELLPGSLFEPVAGRRFDLIVSNPPFVISAGEQRFSYRDSGVAGDGLVRELVATLPAHLNPGGTAQLLANWLVLDGTDWRDRVGGWVAATGLDAWVVQRELAEPDEYVALWLKDAGEDTSKVTGKDAGMDTADSAARLADEWLEYFRRERVRGIGMGLITLRRQPAGPAEITLDEFTEVGDDITGDEAAAFLARRRWLAARSDVDLLGSVLSLSDSVILDERSLPAEDGWRPVYRVLRRPAGPGAVLQLDEWTQGLLAGCRGQLPLAVLLDLFATAHGFDLAALTAVVLPSIRHAVLRGLLHPVNAA
jgi:methylase of polypeptide subunit release factors